MFRLLPTTLLIACLTLPVVTATGADWPEFRGPGGQGHSSEKNLPLTWSETENVAWTVDIPGLGWSSPSIRGRQVWLTTAQNEGHSLRALCIDRDSGQVVLDVGVFSKDEPGPIHQKNSHASPSPVLEEDRVYVHFGKHGTASLDSQGNVLWKTELLYDHKHGPGGSPVIYNDLLIINCDGIDQQFVVALDKHTGEEVWRTDRDGLMAYCTPLLIDWNGKPQLISPGGEWVQAYDPANGAEQWRFRWPGGYSVVPRPVVGHGMVFVSSSYNNATLYAIKLGGTGDVTESHLVWKIARGAPHNPSTLLVGNELYVVSDRGIASCIDAVSGNVYWQERLGGNYSASPLYADGRIYLLDEEGVCHVIAPKQQFERLAQNTLPGRTLASLSTADGAIFLRTDKKLYRLQLPR